MPLGVEVNIRTAPPAQAAPTRHDTLFLAGTFSAGPVTPQLIQSIPDLESVYGITRTGNTALWDYLDVFFREGGRRAWVIRYTAGTGALATALALFNVDLGPGQVVAPSETPNATNFAALADHARNSNRFALLDVANNDTVAATSTNAGLARALTSAEYAALFGPWVNVPAQVGGTGTRQVPASAVIAALIARADQLGNPNRAAAGRDFPLQYATSVVRSFTDAEVNTLIDAGANSIISKYGVLQNYGFQTGLAQDVNNPFWQANASRARMWLRSEALLRMEQFMFKPIDGRGRLLSQVKGVLDSICLDLYGADGLFGATAEEAFFTTATPVINTAGNVANGEVRATVEARFALHARRVLVDLVSVPVTGVVTGAAAQ